MVHGFDIPESDRAGFARLVKRTEDLIASLGLTLHIVRTDVRNDELQEWEHSFGAQLAGVLHQFSEDFDYGLIGSAEPYTHPMLAWGSTPATDYLLSGSDFQIVHEGAGYSRTQKVAALARNPIARRSLKVCWEGAEADVNCGVCEKCVRTRLNFLAAGYGAAECFDSPFDLEMITTIFPKNVAQFTELQGIIDFADSQGIAEPWVEQLRKRLKVLKKLPHGHVPVAFREKVGNFLRFPRRALRKAKRELVQITQSLRGWRSNQ
jgi:hypothetical protein